METRDALLIAGLNAFDAEGFDHVSVAAIRRAAGVSNGSFFHFFGSKEGLAAQLFLQAIRRYHAAMLAALSPLPGAAEGIAALVTAHLDWVVGERPHARFLFEQARAEWMAHIRDEQRAINIAFGEAIEAWRAPLAAAGSLRPLPPALLVSQIIGPAQVFCRAWLSGRDDTDPRLYRDALIDCAQRALLPREEEEG